MKLAVFSFILITSPLIAIDKILLINGGYSPSSNYATHLENLQSVKLAFPDVKAKVFSASGQSGLVVPFDANGAYLRDEGGRVRFKPYEMKGDVKPALKTDIRAGFEASRDAKDLLVFWGDHGGAGKICLWENAGLTPAEKRSLYDLVPKTTRIRAIHAHCFSGSSMIDENRSVPVKGGDIAPFLNTYYPKNVCGIAGSGPDEVGSYIGWGKPASEGPWTKILSASDADLESVKTGLVQLAEPLPRLTSDYLAEDLVKYFCGKREISSESDHVPRAPRPEEEPIDCDEVTESTEFAEANEKFLEGKELATERGWLINGLLRRFMQLKFPEQYEKHKAAVQKIEHLRGEVLLLKENKPTDLKEIKKIEEQILAARTKEMNDFEELQMGIEKGDLLKDEWVTYFKSEGLNKIQEPGFKTTYKQLGSGPNAITKAFFDQQPMNIRIYTESDIYQKKRQEVGLKRQALRKKFVEQELAKDENKKIRETYEAIRKCEKDPLH